MYIPLVVYTTPNIRFGIWPNHEAYVEEHFGDGWECFGNVFGNIIKDVFENVYGNVFGNDEYHDFFCLNDTYKNIK